MKSSPSIARHFIVLALATIFLTNSIAFNVYAAPRSLTVAPTLAPPPTPPSPGTNGRIVYVVEPNGSLDEIYSMNPDGSNPVRLTNNSVNDYSPMYSPDGTHIVFVSYRDSSEDIYLMDADGSNEVRLTTDAAQDNTPAWSPDGTKIAFVSSRSGNDQIFTMNADGSNQVQLTSFGVNKYPTWSPDGTKFAFVSFRLGVDSYELFTMDADGSNPVAITHNSVAESEPGWSPAGDKIVFTRAVGDPNAPNYEIFVINPDGSNEIQLTDNNPRQDVNPTWSPDATKIAFSSNRDNVFGHDVFVIDANGGNLTNITVGNGARGFGPAWGTAPIATPTPTPTATPTPTPVYNGKIAFVSTHFADGNIDIYTMRPDGTEQTRITTDPATESDPDWSPDGTKIAFTSTRDDTSGGLGESGIYIMNADGTNQTRLTDLSDISLFTGTPAFSPDGTKIAYQKGLPNSGNGYDINVYVMNVDGTNPVRLTNIDGMEPTWSPDGSKIAFRSARSFANEIWVMNADGSNPVNLTNNNASNFSPAWSPDGTKIAYGSYLDGNTDIFVMNVDGSNQTRVNNDPSSNEFSPAWSPDGTRIVYFSDLGVYPLTDIYVINADGTGRIQLTSDPDVGENWPAWQPLSAPLPDPTPTPPADLVATSDAQPYEVAPGGTLVLSSAVTNNGPSPGTGVTVEVKVPVDLAINNIDAPGGTCTTTPDPGLGYLVVCSFGNVPVGNVKTIAINTTVNAVDGTGMVAVTTVTSSSPDPDTNNNAAYAQAIVHTPTPPSANLVASSGLDLLAANGATVTHNVSAFNYGPDAAANVKYTIQLPPGATYGTATNPYGSCTASAPDAQGTLVTCTVGNIPAYESRLISHTAIVTGAPYEVLTYTSTVSSDTFDPYLDSNVVGVAVQIEGPPVPTPTPATGNNRLIAFETRRDGNSEIYSRRADGSAQANLTNDPADDADFVWSPDGSKLAFSRLVDAGSNNRDLFVMNANGSNLVRLTNSPDDQDSGAVWSPDGTKLLFTSQSNASVTRALWVTNADGSNQIKIGIAAYDYDNDPTWSPDGTMIAYAREYYDGMNPTERNIYTANADGSNRIRIANAPGESDFTPGWSADGTKINFVREVGGAVDIYDMNVDGSNQRNLSNMGTVHGYPAPSRSVDRSKIALVTGTNGSLDLHVMNVDGSSLLNVFHTSDNVATHSWSPDGTKVVVGTTFNTGLGAGIYVANADGSGSLHFGGDAEYNQDPDWSPDGTRIVFTTRRAGNSNIDIINSDGSGRVALTTDSTYYKHPKWQPIPPPPPPLAEVSAGAALDPLYVATGGQVNYTIYVTNLGPAVAADVTLTSQFPTGVTLDTVMDDAGGTCAPAPDGVNFNCTFASVNPFETKIVHARAVSNVAGAPYTSVITSFTVVTSTPESNTGNNTGTIEFLIAAPALPTPTPGPVNDAEFAYTLFENGSSQTEIFRRRADGAGLMNMTSNLADERDFVWSPDGSKMAFVRYTYDPTPDANIFVMNADGTNTVQLTFDPDQYDVEPSWTRDGTKLAFVSRTPDGSFSVVHTINADGTGLRTFSPPDGFDSEVAFSPDGTHVSFVRRSYITPDTLSPAHIYVVNADGSNPIRFDHSADLWDAGLAWSPDSTRVAFIRFPFSGQGPLLNDIYTARADGTDLQNVTNSANNSATDSPAWSPDGTQIAFASHGAISLLEVMNADGSNRHPIFDVGSWGAVPASWSPDGTRLTFWSRVSEGSEGDVYVVNADGSGLIHIGDDRERNTAPDWSPDSQRLVFQTSRNGVNGINIVNADGTGRVDLTTQAGIFGAPKWRPRLPGNTPAGTNVAVTQNGATVTFSNVTTAGETTITPIDPNSLSGVPGEYVINANSLAFEIHTTAVYTGPITIGFHVPGVNNPITFSALRVLHGEPPPVPNFIDRTVLAPDTLSPNFATRTIYARVTSLSPFLIAEKPANQLTALGPAQVWVGLKNSDDVGTKFDLLAEVFKNGTLIGSGQLNNVVGGSSGFNNAKLNAINLALSGTPTFGPGTTLSIRLSVRIAASSGHRSGTARLWFNDTAANSRFSATIGGVTSSYYLRKPGSSLILATSTSGTTKITIDVLVDRAVGGNPFKPFGTWAITF